MYIKFFGVAVLLVFVLMVTVQGRPQQDVFGGTTTTEQSTWDKIKKGAEHGWQVVYDESHCAFHKVKELVKSHDHEQGSDPCLNKPYKQTTSTTQKSIVLVAEERIPVTSTSRP